MGDCVCVCFYGSVCLCVYICMCVSTLCMFSVYVCIGGANMFFMKCANVCVCVCETGIVLFS